MMETLYWWGIPTLFRCKNDPDPKNCDIALVGVPHSTGNGTTERDQHLGPRAVRHISAGLKRVHLEFGIDPWKQNKIHDLGDVPLPEANNNEKCIEQITQFFSLIADAKKPAMFWAWWKLLKQTRDKFLKDSYKYQVIKDGVYRVFDGVSCFITSEDKLNEYREKLKNLHNTVIPPSWDVLENMPRPVWERDIIKFMPTLRREIK